MGWKGTLRTIGATARRMEREAQRRHKQELKEQIAQDAAADVENWKNYIDELLSVHSNLTERVNWVSMLNQPKPVEPLFEAKHASKAQRKLAAFKPGLFDFLKGGSEKKKAALVLAIEKAKAKDDADFQKVQNTYLAELADWETDRSLAKRLVAGESAAIQEVINEMQTFSRDDLIGSSVQFAISDNYVHARPQVHSDDIIPDYRRKQLASGKLSETKMPVGQFNELYQDYVASVALKVAGDLFQLLPLDEVFVTCESTMLNSATGHKEPMPILSVQFVRSTMMQLNLHHIDPSDSMSNFNHAMAFSKTKGFSPITPLRDDG
jgi:hypothetical protein